MIRELYNLLVWEYGLLERGVKARRHRITGRIEFVLWKKGEKQGDHVHTEDYWYEAASGHEFTPLK